MTTVTIIGIMQMHAMHRKITDDYGANARMSIITYWLVGRVRVSSTCRLKIIHIAGRLISREAHLQGG